MLVCLCLLAALTPGAYANTNDSLLTRLAATIHAAPQYDAARVKEIQQLTQALQSDHVTDTTIFSSYEKIYEAYKVFNYDSAYTYARRLIQLSRHIGGNNYTAAAKLKLSFILLSAGLYKETYDSLLALSRQPVPDALKGEYYTLWGRYYYDLAGYANDNYHSVNYDIEGSKYLDSALHYYIPGSFEAIYYNGLLNLKRGKTSEASHYLEQLMQQPGLTAHQLALTASTLSAIYQGKGDMDNAISLLIRATVADIESSTKETVAIFHLSELLYKKGDLKHAVMCIESAISNAEFYGARQRKVQASSILPLIEGARISGIEAQKNRLANYAILVTLLVVALVVLAFVVLRQVKKLQLAQQALKAANTLQQQANEQLGQANRQLALVNDELEDANKIKQEYIGYFFNMDSEFYGKLDKIKMTIEQKLHERKYEDIRFVLNKIDARKEKEELLLSFDKIFLKLFPDFVAEVNSLLRDDERIVLKDGELMSTDLRIFALMRMGVTDPEKIAQILEYSVKTIYSYKSRIKNKATMPGDVFEEKIMQVKSVSPRPVSSE
ncbi:tetratricopeptide repeat protein [Deminuibacter soli]|uniref:Tetratricopeptide repeat protein n=1 Tax=Deminuibacter soli TaxID=2291815 RepID=A0A3E1NGI7_9BACT|nr:tetratricopeptide repeat protein [Deminuibacter soli]